MTWHGKKYPSRPHGSAEFCFVLMPCFVPKRVGGSLQKYANYNRIKIDQRENKAGTNTKELREWRLHCYQRSDQRTDPLARVCPGKMLPACVTCMRMGLHHSHKQTENWTLSFLSVKAKRETHLL